MNPTKASKHFNIPRQTNVNHLNGYLTTQVGRPTYFSDEDEKVLILMIEKMADWGYGLNWASIKSLVGFYAETLNKSNLFKNDIHGDD